MAKYVLDEAFLQRVERLQTALKNNLTGMFGGNHQSKMFGSSSDFSDHKVYVPGDDINKIDWNVFARFEQLYVKLYQDERRLHTKIYIDVSRSMDFGKKAEIALQVAATLAYLSVVELDRVTIFTVRDSRIEEVVGQMSGREQFFEKITQLNNIEFGGECFWSQALLPQDVGFADGLTVIISDFLTDSDYEAAIDYLVDKKRDLLCVQILAQEEMHPQVRGKNHFIDSECPSEYYRKNITKDVIFAYKKALEHVISRISNYCNARGGVYLPFSDAKPVDEIFFNDLVATEVLK